MAASTDAQPPRAGVGVSMHRQPVTQRQRRGAADRQLLVFPHTLMMPPRVDASIMIRGGPSGGACKTRIDTWRSSATATMTGAGRAGCIAGWKLIACRGVYPARHLSTEG